MYEVAYDRIFHQSKMNFFKKLKNKNLICLVQVYTDICIWLRMLKICFHKDTLKKKIRKPFIAFSPINSYSLGIFPSRSHNFSDNMTYEKRSAKISSFIARGICLAREIKWIQNQHEKNPF